MSVASFLCPTPGVTTEASSSGASRKRIQSNDDGGEVKSVAPTYEPCANKESCEREDAFGTLKALLETSDPTDLDSQNQLRETVLQCPLGVPETLRGDVWCRLLGVPIGTDDAQNDAFSRFVRDGVLDAPNQRVIRSDIERTRATMSQFKCPNTRDLMEKMLTFYCKQKAITYKQGLNEVLAPFFILQSERFPPALVYRCFSMFVPRFLPLFGDDEFTSLQCAFLLFKHLLLYHDPFLTLFLEHHGVSPELYVTPWFLTAFASKTWIEYLMCLWDYYIAEGDRFYFCFIAVALLHRHRQRIFQTEVSQLPETLTHLGLNSFEELHEVWDLARLLKRRTPSSFHSRLSSVHGNKYFSPHTLHLLDSEYGFHVLPQEILRHCYGLCRSAPLGSGSQNLWKLFLVDIRPHREVEAGRLPLSVHVDVEDDPNWETTVDVLAASACSSAKLGLDDVEQESPQTARQQYHVCLMQTDGVQQAEGLRHMFRYFTRKLAFRWVSIVLGGYAEAHRLALASGLELVDHQPTTCHLCCGSPKPPPAPPRRSSRIAKPASTSASVVPRHSGGDDDGSGFSLMGALRRVRPKRRAATTSDTSPKECQDGSPVLQEEDNRSRRRDLVHRAANCSCALGGQRKEDASLLVYEDHFALVTGQRRLATYSVSAISKITSKKAQPTELFFYFTEKEQEARLHFTLNFKDEAAAIACVASIKHVYRKYRQALNGGVSPV